MSEVKERIDLEILDRLKEGRERILEEIRKVVVGQREIIDDLLTALLARGHILLVGAPGLAKTLMIKTLAQVLDLKFSRIQFTPDLMPSDITGTEIIQETPDGRREFRFVKGPVFANIILADEINRTPPKTQAALLQAMQEYSVTVGNVTYQLDLPFLVLATQNPIEMEGTYPLPEAQLDRFMFNSFIDYPTDEETVEIVKLTTTDYEPELDVVFRAEEILEFQRLVRLVPIAEHIIGYAVELVSRTRPSNEGSPDFVKRWVQWGASPRAVQYLVLGGKARSAMSGQPYVSAQEIRAVAHQVLRHRIIPNYTAQAEGVDVDGIIDKLLQTVKEPKG